MSTPAAARRDATHATPKSAATPAAKPHASKPGQKEETEPNAETRQSTFLEDGTGSVIGQGEAGFSRAMLRETSRVADELDTGAANLLTPLSPSTSGAERQVAQRAKEQAQYEDKASSHFNNASLKAMFTREAKWCKDHGTQIATDVTDERGKFQAFNSWGSRANAFFTALQRLQAQKAMLGVKTTAELVDSLVSGLRDTHDVAQHMQVAHDSGHAGPPHVPSSNDSVTTLAADTTLAAQKLRTAAEAYQSAELMAREKKINEQGAPARAQLAQIESNKAFIAGAGRVIDLSLSALEAAPKLANSAIATVKRGDAKLNAAKNKRQIMNGEKQTHNPTHMTTNKKDETVMRNEQTGTDLNPETRERTRSPDGGGISIPTSPGAVLSTITDFVYYSDVEKLHLKLAEVQAHCAMIHDVAEWTAVQAKAHALQDASLDYALRCLLQQRGMEQRRQDYLEFGVDLDNYARTDRGMQRAGLAPQAGGERHAAILTVTATVREVVALGRAALSGFSMRDLHDFVETLDANRARTDHIPGDAELMNMPAAELMQFVKMGEQVNAFQATASSTVDHLSPVESRSDALMAALAQGGAGGAY